MTGVTLDFIVLPLLLVYALIVRCFRKNSKSKIFIGCFPNNNLVQVSQALKEKGYQSIVFPLRIPEHERGKVAYDYDIQKTFPQLYTNWLGNRLIFLGVFVWAMWKYEIFIMPFLNRLLDSFPLLQWFEFQLLKLANKRIILNPYASDIYTPKITLKDKPFTNVLRDYESDPYYSRINEKYVLKARGYGEKWADAVVAALDLVDYLNRVDHKLQMRCIDTRKIKPIYPKNTQKLRIVHAPNHRSLKGTKYLIDAVDKINQDQQLIELEIIEMQSNKVVLEKIKQADCIADQFLMGAYGRLAIEAMAHGKPVLCYLRDDLIPLYPHWSECPILNTSVDTIKSKLNELLDMSSNERITLGKKSRKYAEKYHSLEYIGQQMHQIIQRL